MDALYPLQFRPVLKRYIWGGRRLGSVLGKPIGEGSDYAESWEVADHASGQSVVADGSLAGTTLHDLVVNRADELLGRHAAFIKQQQSRFPLLFKFLDCQRDLSVQVHPDDAAAPRLDPPDLGKTEAWVILEAEPGSRIYAGLAPGCDRPALARAVKEGKIAECLHSFEARAGQCVFIPAGTVHALGAGVVVAEIQQASDTTYRLYDWDRVGPDGKPRQLHVNESLAAIDYSAVAVSPQAPVATAQSNIERLVSCDKFVLDRWKIQGAERLGGDDRFHIVSVLSREVNLIIDKDQMTLTRGQTTLIPACMPPAMIEPANGATLLDMYLP
jgi:mannose-6-phosphate isomerase